MAPDVAAGGIHANIYLDAQGLRMQDLKGDRPFKSTTSLPPGPGRKTVFKSSLRMSHCWSAATLVFLIPSPKLEVFRSDALQKRIWAFPFTLS